MPASQVQVDGDAERATLGAVLLLGAKAASGLAARGLRPEHFYYSRHVAVFKACLSLADREAALDVLTVGSELDRLGLRDTISRGDVDVLTSYVPAAGNYAAYADRVIELARWRDRQRVLYELTAATEKRDAVAFAQATARLESATAGTRTESYSPAAWAALMFDHFAGLKDGAQPNAIRLPWPRLTQALGSGLWRGEVMVVSGPTAHGKSICSDQMLDHNAEIGYNCHLYVTEMTALARGMRYIARKTGVSFMNQRRGILTDQDRKEILGALPKFAYGITIASDWSVDDIVRDALRARYDMVCVDLLHGFHYEDERGLDRLSKAMQKLARVSTTLDGHPGTAVVAVTHLKEEGVVKGMVPRPAISSIKGGSSIKQDADFVMFVWQEQENGVPTGDGEIWLAKGRSGEIASQPVRLNKTRFRFETRDVLHDEFASQPAGAF